MALPVGFRILISLDPATQATGLRLLPRWDCLPLDAPAFAGRTVTANWKSEPSSSMAAPGPTVPLPAARPRPAGVDPESPNSLPETGRSTTQKATLNSTEDRYLVSPTRG